MAELGRVLPPRSGGPRGRDLEVRVQVPPRALGAPGGVHVRVPQEIEGHRRVVSRHDSPDRVHLHLPSELPSGAGIRLRGQGARPEGEGEPGDLLVRVEVREDAEPGWGECVPAPRSSLSWTRWWWVGALLAVLILFVAALIMDT